MSLILFNYKNSVFAIKIRTVHTCVMRNPETPLDPTPRRARSRREPVGVLRRSCGGSCGGPCAAAVPSCCAGARQGRERAHPGRRRACVVLGDSLGFPDDVVCGSRRARGKGGSGTHVHARVAVCVRVDDEALPVLPARTTLTVLRASLRVRPCGRV